MQLVQWLVEGQLFIDVVEYDDYVFFRDVVQEIEQFVDLEMVFGWVQVEVSYDDVDCFVMDVEIGFQCVVWFMMGIVEIMVVYCEYWMVGEQGVIEGVFMVYDGVIGDCLYCCFVGQVVELY